MQEATPNSETKQTNPRKRGKSRRIRTLSAPRQCPPVNCKKTHECVEQSNKRRVREQFHRVKASLGETVAGKAIEKRRSGIRISTRG